MNNEALLAAAIIEDGVAEHEALNGVPIWLDIPDELTKVIETVGPDQIPKRTPKG